MSVPAGSHGKVNVSHHALRPEFGMCSKQCAMIASFHQEDFGIRVQSFQIGLQQLQSIDGSRPEIILTTGLKQFDPLAGKRERIDVVLSA